MNNEELSAKVLLVNVTHNYCAMSNAYMNAFQKSCMFWMPAQAVNFLLVPQTMRVVYIAACSFAWVNILCIAKRA